MCTGEDASGDVRASSDPTNGANTCFGVEDLGFGVWGLNFRAQGASLEWNLRCQTGNLWCLEWNFDCLRREPSMS